MARLKEQYKNEMVDALMKKFGYKNVMQVPKLDKIVVNMGVGEAKENAKILDSAVRDLEIITGQKPHCPVCVTLGVSTPMHLTAGAIMLWASKSS